MPSITRAVLRVSAVTGSGDLVPGVHDCRPHGRIVGVSLHPHHARGHIGGHADDAGNTPDPGLHRAPTVIARHTGDRVGRGHRIPPCVRAGTAPRLRTDRNTGVTGHAHRRGPQEVGRSST